jgi:hypothetical protein
LRVTSVAADDLTGTGAQQVIVYGIDANRNEQVEVIELDGAGVGYVDTVTTWLGVNRLSIALAGTGKANAGDITITAGSAGPIMAQIPTGVGTSQQCIFHTPADHQFLADFIKINSLKQSGASPRIKITGWLYSSLSNCKYEVLAVEIDTSVENTIVLNPNQPFVLDAGSVFWLECTTDKATTKVNSRFSGILVRNVDSIEI